MAESFKIDKVDPSGFAEARAVFPRLEWQVNTGTKVAKIYDAKKEEWVVVEDGNYIVSIGDRFEVAESEPEKAHPVEAPEPEAEEAPVEAAEPEEKPRRTRKRVESSDTDSE